MSDALNFRELRVANLERLPLFKNRRGDIAHTEPDGSDWSLAEWFCAISGEVGEGADLAKKLRRGDFTLESRRGDIADEMADAVIYLDIAASVIGVDLGEAVRQKFNEVSRRIGVDIRL